MIMKSTCFDIWGSLSPVGGTISLVGSRYGFRWAIRCMFTRGRECELIICIVCMDLEGDLVD